jgi:hypothetical protein
MTDNKEQEQKKSLRFDQTTKEEKSYIIPDPKKIDNSSLSHLNYECPGLTGAGSQMDIMPKSFQNLFQSKYPIVIPLLQRTYCWSDELIKNWWRDSVNYGKGNCSTGKCIFFMENNNDSPHLLAIDGQQRCTTQQILFSSFRDASLLLARDCDMNGNIDKTKINLIIDNQESYLFKNVKEMRLWSKTFTNDLLDILLIEYNKMKDNVNEDQLLSIISNIWSTTFIKGENLPFPGIIQLLPSFVDRSPFFEILCSGRIANDLFLLLLSNNELKFLANNAKDIIIQQSKHTISSRQGAAKSYFDKKIISALEPYNSEIKTLNNINKAILILNGMINKSNKMSIMYCEILSEINLYQVFLWLQEKSLFGMGALLHNPNPGIAFKSSDLVRNLLLQSLCKLNLSEQEIYYRKKWLEPIEMKLDYSDLCDCEKLMNEFLNNYYNKFNNKTDINNNLKFVRHTGDFETKLNQLIASLPPAIQSMGDSPSLKIYGRFQSFVEEIELNNQDSINERLIISEKTCSKVLEKLASYTPIYIKSKNIPKFIEIEKVSNKLNLNAIEEDGNDEM